VNIFGWENLSEDYEESLEKYGASPKALLWWDYRSMAIRFRQLVKDLNIDDKTILDAGCGMGDLLPYLYAESTNFKYLGVDKNKGFIEIAKKRYEGHDFKEADPFDKQIGTYDVVISSGVMNGNYKGWLEERKRMIKMLYSHCQEVLAFNMAGGLRPIANDSLIAYADAKEIYDYCATLSDRVILRAHYLNNDFTVVMYKSEPG
jgi:SAM-dependent methyltransferase